MDHRTLGGLTLVRRLGEGGMGEVWEARHPSGERVAVKWIRGERAARPEFRVAFQREVEATAAMDHPAILLVYDHGTATAQEAAAIGGAVQAGAPYLVVELASGGALDERPAPRSFGEVRRILLAVLDALAHAHARGVVHRDLKPGNLLLCTDADRRPGLKLADFGLAEAVDRDERHPRAAGTPWYMAPEQLTGRWRDVGPATDLYALGVLAWQLITGAVPFPLLDVADLRQHHLYAPPPPLRPLFAIPEGADAWLAALLAKAPGDRPESAAQAAWWLSGLPEPAATEVAVTVEIPMRVSTPTFTWTEVPVDATAATARPTAVRVAQRPPLPEHWAHGGGEQPPVLLGGAGRGLFPVRTAPFTGRREERDALWAALAQALAGEARAVAIAGPEGIGKSRLARWVAERAVELGVAVALEARFHEPRVPTEGLLGMVHRRFRIGGLGADDARDRIVHGTDAPDPLLELIDGAQGSVGAVAAWIASEARDTPTIVVLDDAHLAAEAVDLTRHLLAAAGIAPLRLLILLTVRDDPRGDEVVARLSPLPAFGLHRLAPLDAQVATILLERALDLDPGLCARVHGSTGGHPGLMLQVVADWVQRDRLRPGPRGLTVPDDEADALPASLSEVWRRRVESTLSRLDDGARACVAIAATSGRQVDPRWVEVCHQRGHDDPLAAASALLAAGLATADGDVWRFASPTAHAAVLAALPDPVREAHLAWVDALLPHPVADGDDRLATHLAAAGLHEEAADALLASTEAGHIEAYDRLLGLVDRCEASLDAAAVGPDDPRRHELMIRRTVLLANLHHPGVKAAAEQLLVTAGSGRVDATRRIRMLEVIAQIAGRAGELDLAEHGARQLLAEGGHAARMLVLLGSVAVKRRDPETARAYVEQALGLNARDTFNRAAALTLLAEIARLQGRLDEAEAVHRQAYELTSRGGYAEATTSELNLALVDMDRGRWAAADAQLSSVQERALRRFDWYPLLTAAALRHRTSAELGAWDTWDALAELLPHLHRVVQTPDPDTAEQLHQAGRLAHAAGFTERARGAWRMALTHADALGDIALVNALRACLGALDDES